MNKTTAMQVQDAKYFFRPAPKLLVASAAESSTTDKQGMDNVPQMFQANGNTTGSVMQFNGRLRDDVSDEVRQGFASLLSGSCQFSGLAHCLGSRW
ncbi:hypothetical protein V2S84_26665 [Azotobacter chroococcum]|nr:hypothetical protein [Azotobacter chroococcum]